MNRQEEGCWLEVREGGKKEESKNSRGGCVQSKLACLMWKSFCPNSKALDSWSLSCIGFHADYMFANMILVAKGQALILC